MTARRVAVLVGKELVYGSKNLMFIFAVVIPLLFSLIVSLLVGTLFAGKPRLGIADLGSSQLPGQLSQLDYVTTRVYGSAAVLRADVERGALDIGVVLPNGFDAALKSGGSTDLELYVWGESLLKHRTVLGATLSRQVIALAGREIPIQTATTLLGDKASISWDVRLFPMLVAFAVLLGGMLIPSTALVEEKEKRTLTALTVTPATLGEVMTAKGIVGALVSVLMGMLILTINGAWSAQPALMLLVLVLSAVEAAAFGVILGTVVSDINTLFTAIKGLGLLLYAPPLIYMFPQIPQWVARVFPTYYMIGPIVELSLNGATWGGIARDVAVLCALIVATTVAAALLAARLASPVPSFAPVRSTKD
jgi:ABC-2 type transport system permease protein